MVAAARLAQRPRRVPVRARLGRQKNGDRPHIPQSEKIGSVPSFVEVAAAVIERTDGAFLLAQRPAGKVYAGWWEFPGGKVDPGESAHAALVRELHEELAIDVTRAYPWITREYAYPHATVRLNFFRVTRWSGDPHPKEDQRICWQRIDQPIVEPMLPANAPVLRSLALPLEYAITDAQAYGVARMLERLEVRLAQGLRLVQVRDKDLPDRPALIREVVARAREHGARVLVNGGPDVADGLHLPATRLRVPVLLACGTTLRRDPQTVARAAPSIALRADAGRPPRQARRSRARVLRARAPLPRLRG